MAAVKNRVAALKGTFVPLLVALLALLVVAPFAEGYPLAAAFLVACLLVTGVFSVHKHSLLRRVLLMGIALVLALRWLAHVYGEEYRILVILGHSSICLYMLTLAAICVTTVLRREQITTDTVIGAVCGYLLIAYVFVFAYAFLEDVNPGNFNSRALAQEYEDAAKIGRGTPELLYYSFVTLTTVGYGDIVPASRVARSLAILEMLAGQLYLAAFVARLVGVMGTRGNDSEANAADRAGP